MRDQEGPFLQGDIARDEVALDQGGVRGQGRDVLVQQMDKGTRAVFALPSRGETR